MTIASTIILIGLIVFAGVTASTVISTINTLAYLRQMALRESGASAVKIDLTISSVEASKIRFYLRNSGSKPVFLREEGYNWNTIIVSYRNVYLRTYIIEDYEVLEIRIAGTNHTINMDSFRSLNPSEEALIEVHLPSEAPEIPLNGTVIVVFASHYGVAAVGEAVRL
ncbi:MAG: hypothetical protein QW502_02410 [Candidatus Bathyarchaeia archaeon]|nr:hypothetical protein [Candidatus Bathyarchaeota archaeon]